MMVRQAEIGVNSGGARLPKDRTLHREYQRIQVNVMG